jgi:hypothetical protein
MSIAIATMGKFWPAAGGGTITNTVYLSDGGASGFDAKNYRKPKPVVVIRRVNSSIKQKPKIKVTEVIS